MEIPFQINSLLQENEEVDFCVKSKLFQKPSTSASQVFGGLIFTAFPLVIFYLMFRNQLQLNSISEIFTNITSNEIMMLIFPILILSIFLIIGLLMFFGGIVYFFVEGGYFIGTNYRFITFRKGSVKFYNWEQFDNKGVEVQMPDKIGLKLRTGVIRSSGSKKKHNYKESFVQEQLWIVGIENVGDIARKCNIRIEKNKV